MECIIAKASEGDIAHVSANLREEHVREIRGMTNMDPAAAVRRSMAISRIILAGRMAFDDGTMTKALFIVGVEKTCLLSDVGSVWMLATREIDDYALSAAAALRELFRNAHALAGARVLEQWLPPWYRKGIKFMLWLGWRAGEVKRVGAFGEPHIRMVHEE